MRPTSASAAASPSPRPLLPLDSDPFDFPTPPQTAVPHEPTAATMFPLLAAALAETSAVPVHGAMTGPSLATGTRPAEGHAAPAGYSLPSGGFSPAPQPASPRYAMPDDFDAMPPAALPSRAGAPRAPSPYYIPEALSPAPEAPANLAQMAHESDVVRAYAPPAAADYRPAAVAANAATPAASFATSYEAPPPVVAAQGAPPAAESAMPAFVTLAAHFPPPGVGPAGVVADGTDRRSLAEMFRVLSDRSGSPHLPQGGLAGGAIEEPGLFRRI